MRDTSIQVLPAPAQASTATLRRVYQENHVPERFREEAARLDDAAIAEWVSAWTPKQ